MYVSEVMAMHNLSAAKTNLTPRRISPTDFLSLLPKEVRELGQSQNDIPRIAKNPKLMAIIESAIASVTTRHDFHHGDARDLSALDDESVHLIVTSPPYWNLKEYHESAGQLGHISEYEKFIHELNRVWKHCIRVLVPGGRLICVVGDVCLSRRKNSGRHTVVPLHATIQESCRKIGFDNLAPIIWHKIANAQYEAGGNSSFLGKPYEPNAVIKNDIEFILMERKPGGYRNPERGAKLLSVISAENHKKWFQQIWEGVTGASTKDHPAPFPLELAERLVRMFSFVGDTILDPFMGTATTNIAAARWGRNSIGFEIDDRYTTYAQHRFEEATFGMFNRTALNIFRGVK